jgi:poly-gamma-glutamate synthesis protein (capsule biosynthesis protein)
MYSLGNFVATNAYWEDGYVLSWNKRERTGCILLIEMDCQRVLKVIQVPTYDSWRQVTLAESRSALKRITKLNQAIARE